MHKQILAGFVYIYHIWMSRTINIHMIGWNVFFYSYGTFFHHEEDYRWPILRTKMHPVLFWLVFNFSFIASYQVLL